AAVDRTFEKTTGFYQVDQFGWKVTPYGGSSDPLVVTIFNPLSVR
ncbi:MAG: hypothetical protein ACD_61C00205G0003, partial [uncultured bacterium]